MATETYNLVSSGQELNFSFNFENQKLMKITAIHDGTPYECRLQLKTPDGDSPTMCCRFIDGVLFCEPGPCE